MDVVYADGTGIGHQITGAAALPSAATVVIAANENRARTNRLKQLLSGATPFTVDDLKRQQHDLLSWNAGQLVPRLAGVHTKDARVEQARAALLTWDRRITAGSSAAALYLQFERALWRQISEAVVPAALLDDYLGLAHFNLADAMKASEGTLLNALSAAVRQAGPSGAQVVFTHPLAITQAARRLFNVGPFSPGGYADTVLSFSTRSNVDIGASFREIIDVSDWDRSVVTNAPGQSAWPRSPHFSDLATLWAAGEYFPLSFSEQAIEKNAESTLTLQPR